ncbi:MAG: hypothetical protein KIT57_05060 [Blastocatellales bacterium]|nr:hypothetical protein [Blastocatellales bacterium]
MARVKLGAAEARLQIPRSMRMRRSCGRGLRKSAGAAVLSAVGISRLSGIIPALVKYIRPWATTRSNSIRRRRALKTEPGRQALEV